MTYESPKDYDYQTRYWKGFNVFNICVYNWQFDNPLNQQI